MDHNSTPENSVAIAPAARQQFGLRQVMLMIASVALILALGTQLENACFDWAIAVTILLVGVWWSHWTRTVAPVVLAMVLLILANISPAIQQRRPSPEAICQTRLVFIVQALRQYAEANNGNFPPAYVADENGRPMHSWRILILPYLDSDAHYQKYRFDEPWDSPHNLKIARQIPEAFQCPAIRKNRGVFTSYLAVTGHGTAWSNTESITIGDITDGVANTLCLVEWPESDVIWTEPRDLPIERISILKHSPAVRKSKQYHLDGQTVAMANGVVKSLAFHEFADRQIRALCTRAGNDNADLPSD